MKTIFPLLLLACFALSCAKNAKTKLTEEQKSTIKAEIKAQFDLSGQGIEEMDAEKAFSVFSKMEGVKYIRDGHLYPAIDSAKNQYAQWFSSPGAVRRKLTADPVIFDILDENTVLLTTIGSFTVVDDTTGQPPVVIAYTMLWRKEDEGWKLFHMHNSWE